MTQRIKVQDGKVIYQANDPDYSLDLNVDGQVSVTKTVSVGFDPDANGILTATGNGNLILNTIDNNIRLSPDYGNILLSNVSWPELTSGAHPGTFLGSSALNTLKFQPFVLGLTASDSLTQDDLTALYPDAQPGQYLVGQTVVYLCIGVGAWRTLGTNKSKQLITLNQDVTGEGYNLISTTLSSTGVVPGYYTNANIIVDIKGRILQAGNGTASLTSLLNIKTIYTTTYTLIEEDGYNMLIRVVTSAPAVVTIPADTTFNFPIGTNVLLSWNGSGQVSVNGEFGVVIDSPDTYAIYRRYGKITLIKTEANHWEIEGNLEPYI